MLFEVLGVYPRHTSNSVLEYVLKLKKCKFSSLQNILNCKAENPI